MNNYVTVKAPWRAVGMGAGSTHPVWESYQLSERTSESQPPLRTAYTLITP